MKKVIPSPVIPSPIFGPGPNPLRKKYESQDLIKKDLKKDYSLVFLFKKEMDQVLLIRKIKPEWQNGLFNGVGGLKELSDKNFLSCAIREMHEETGLVLKDDQLKEICSMHGKDNVWNVNVFAGIYDSKMGEAKTLTAEDVEWVLITPHFHEHFHPQMLPNLLWLIPMCVSVLTGKDDITAEIKYK